MRRLAAVLRFFSLTLALFATSSCDDDGGAVCGQSIPARGSSECPAACTGGCDGAVCTIECSGLATCAEDHIVCPADFDCVVRCIGHDACDSGRIDCPADTSCTVVCDGVDGCGDQSVTCGSGPCSIECGTDSQACTGMNVHCGPGPCAASCAGTSAPYDLIGCADSCRCTECEGGGGDGDADADADGDGDADADGDGDATFENVTAWVEAYAAEHPGRDGDINAKSPDEIAADPDAQRLLALCGDDQRPVIPLLAWEYGGSDHAWIDPEAGALVYCVYIPVDPGTEHWNFADQHVTADVYVLFPDENPCAALAGAEQVAGCIGDVSNFEILVDTASLHDGQDVGLELSEASTELRLLPPGGGPPIHLWDDL